MGRSTLHWCWNGERVLREYNRVASDIQFLRVMTRSWLNVRPVWIFDCKTVASVIDGQSGLGLCTELIHDIVVVSDTARDLGVVIDSQQMLSAHVASLTRSYQLRKLRPIVRSLSTESTRTLVQAFIFFNFLSPGLLHLSIVWHLQWITTSIVVSTECCSTPCNGHTPVYIIMEHRHEPLHLYYATSVG